VFTACMVIPQHSGKDGGWQHRHAVNKCFPETQQASSLCCVACTCINWTSPFS
jgi:hypothetical protein